MIKAYGVKAPRENADKWLKSNPNRQVGQQKNRMKKSNPNRQVGQQKNRMKKSNPNRQVNAVKLSFNYLINNSLSFKIRAIFFL